MTLSQKQTLRSRNARSGDAIAVSLSLKERVFLRTGLVVFVAIALFAFGAAHAKAALEIKNEVFQEIEVKNAEGKVEKKIVPASMVVPGTEVQYVVTYVNKGDQAAGQVAITNPVPGELEYVSATGAGTVSEVSVDGGKNYGALANLKVTGADGKSRPARATDVTHVRWRLDAALKPGEEGKVSFRARLK